MFYSQFLGISLVVGREAIGHLHRREAPDEGGMLLAISIASVLVLSTLCGLKLDLSVTTFLLTCIARLTLLLLLAILAASGMCSPCAS